MFIILLVLGLMGIALCIVLYHLWRTMQMQSDQLLQSLKIPVATQTQEIIEKISLQQLQTLQTLQDGLQKGRQETSQQVQQALLHNRYDLTERIDKFRQMIEDRMKEMSGQVDRRLNEGLQTANQIFTDIIRRLTLIDQAQQKITELSGNMLSLKDLLNDKRSRGAFGEVQLSALIRNIIPDLHFQFHTTLSNGKRADCILYLPQPTGNVVIDSKFPMENYQKLTDSNLNDIERRQAEQLFKRDIKKHIQDIAQKYIIPGETTDGAIMFIPAEAVFAEIHAHYPMLVEISHQAKVWLASPSTMMAILTTVRSVIRDDATRQQVHIIRAHLCLLAEDFDRFQQRMDGLQRHIEQANDDVRQVNISARKISSRFEKIENVELEKADNMGVLSENQGV